MSGLPDRASPTDDTWLAERFDGFVEGLLDGETADLQAAIAEHPELEDRIRESWELALQVSGRRPAPTLHFAGYAILRELGHGGMGTVYLAHNETLGRDVALKVLPPSLGLSVRAKTRFLNEARALARVEDEHIVRIYDVVERQELLAYEMEWVDGKSLRQLIDALKPMGRDASLRHLATTLGAEEPELQTKSLISYLVQLGASIARALHKVHAAGLVHRDVKPSNILVRRDGTPLLADFGLARGTDSSLTQSGAFAGTAVYAAPEQLRGESESVDGRADVYALGVTLYEALAHRMPFQGRNTTEVLSRIERGDVMRLRKLAPGVPRDLETIVHKAMDPDPERRYASANELADDLERLLHLQPIRARPAGPWERSVKLIRRHRGRLVAAAVGAAAGVLVLAAVLLNERRAELRRQDFDDLVRQARLHLLAPERESRTFNQLARGHEAPIALHSGAVPGLLEASRAYEQALELDPERTEIALEHAMVEVVLQRRPDLEAYRARHGVLVDAIDQLHLFNNLRDLDPNEIEQASAETRRVVGLLAFLLGNVAICEQAWDGLDPSDFPILDAALGVVYLVDDRPERAYPRLDRACEVFPEAVFLRVKLADAAVSVQDNRRAASLLAELCSTSGLPDALRADLARIRADLMANRGETEAARQEYERLAEGQPDAPTPTFRLAQLDLDAGAARSALRRLKNLVARFPGVARYRRALATAALQVEDVSVYLRQARHAVSAEFGAGRSPGTIRDLLTILWDGGLQGLHQRGVERTRHLRPIAEARHPMRFPVSRGPMSSPDLVEAALLRVAAFDRDLTASFAILLPDGPERVAAEALATAAGVVLHYPELLGALHPRSAWLCYGAALACRGHWSAVTDHVLPTFLDTSERVGAKGQGSRRPLHTFESLEHGDMFGSWAGVALLPDIDGDGCTEAIIGAPQLARDPILPGYVRVYSGSNGRLLHEFRGKANGDGFGFSVAAAGDVDADGCPDVIVGARGGGYAVVFSGRTGEEIRKWSGPAAGLYGWTVDGAGDLDRDGHADVLVTALTENYWSGSVRVYSGRTGEELVPALHGSSLEALGAGACGAGDVDQDGFPDIAVSAPNSAINGTMSGRVEVISGRWIAERNGRRTIHTWHGEKPGDLLGQRLASAGDVDGDGHPDLIAGACAANDFTGYARVYSGGSGRVLWTEHGKPGDGFGISVSGAGDVDGDGHDDVLISAADKPAGLRGSVRLYSGRTRRLLDRWDGKAERDALVAISGGHGLILMGACQSTGAPPFTAVGPGYVWLLATNVPGSFVPLSEEGRPSSR